METPVVYFYTQKKQALSLLLPLFDSRENPREKALRLIGLRLEKLF